MLLHRHVILWERARRSSSSYARSKETSGDSVRGGKTALMKWNISQMSIHYYWERRWHRWLRGITHHQARGKTTAFLNKFHKFNCDRHYLDARFLENDVPNPGKNIDLIADKIGGKKLDIRLLTFSSCDTGANEVCINL